MAPKKGDRDTTSKKAAGMAKKAEVAAQKAAKKAAEEDRAESERWEQGAKNNSKKAAEADKKAELARKKAERDALLAEEEASTPGRAQPKNAKSAAKKTRGLDLSQLDSPGTSKLSALNASGIDNALDALSITHNTDSKVERHPERRYPAAYAKYEERRLREMEADGSGAGLRMNQRKERIKKEFERSPENPFNQVNAQYNASKEEISEIASREKAKIESRLGR